MAQYFEDFRDATVGPAPPEFVLAWHGPVTSTIETGNPLPESDRNLYLVGQDSSFARNAVRWDVGEASGVTTVRALLGYHWATFPQVIPGPVVGGRGVSSQRTGYVHWAGTNNRLSRYNNGSDSSVASSSNPFGAEHNETTIHAYHEIRRDGALVEVRLWMYGDPRPETPNISYTDPSPLPEGGFFGVSAMNRSPSYGLRVFSLAVGTGGQEPPDGPGGGGGVATPTNLGVQVLSSTTARLTWEKG